MNTKSLIQSSRILLAVGVSCLLLQSANATVLVEEGFNYTSGSGLGGQVNPRSHSNTWTSGNSGLTIGSANLTYAGLADLAGNELNIQNATAGSSILQYIGNVNQTSGQVYYSFLFDPLVINGGNNYFTALNPGTGAPNGGSDAIDMQYFLTVRCVYVLNAAAATGSHRLDDRYDVSVVLDLDLTTRVANMWINPDASSFGVSAPGRPP